MYGYAVPTRYLIKMGVTERYNPVQTHKLSWGILRGLKKAGCSGIDVLSTFPASTYPNNKTIFFRLIKWMNIDGNENIILPYINILILKHISKFIVGLIYLCRWNVRNRNMKKTILLYGSNSSLLYSAIIVSQIFRIKIIGVLTDPPGISLPDEGVVTRFFRKIDRQLLITAYSRIDGIIALTEALVDRYSFTKPSMILEGIISEDSVANFSRYSQKIPPKEDGAVFTVLYAGGISEDYGLGLLLESMQFIKKKHFKLKICGWGPMVAAVEEYSCADNRIEYLGNLAQKELTLQMLQASVLINPRPSKDNFTELSFPSKTIEYLASGKPVLCTRLKGIPEDYYQYLVAIEDETPAGIAAAINKLRKKPEEELLRIGNRGKCFVENNKNESRQGKRIHEFIKNI